MALERAIRDHLASCTPMGAVPTPFAAEIATPEFDASLGDLESASPFRVDPG